MFQPNDADLWDAIRDAKCPNELAFAALLQEAEGGKELDVTQIAALLKSHNKPSRVESLARAANRVKEKHFANALTLYVPVYLSSRCANNCIYCGFRRDNSMLKRNSLSLDDFARELEYVLDIGHRTIELVLGYDLAFHAARLADYVALTRHRLSQRGGGTVILMSEPLDVAGYRTLCDVGLDAVYCWQETYDQARYAEVHLPSTHKHDYEWRVGTAERVLRAGIPWYGMGILFGLQQWEYDVLALVTHARWLTEQYGVPPHAFGIPRMKPAEGALRHEAFNPVTDAQYRIAVAIYRLCFPRAHIYMNTRENMGLILRLAKGGGSQVNTDATTVPGGYSGLFENGEQFFHYNYATSDAVSGFIAEGLRPVFQESCIPL
jgi:2-iminoacetate synthase